VTPLGVLAKPSVTTNIALRWQAYCTMPVLVSNWSPITCMVLCVGVAAWSGVRR
jgi:hypothetical protein